MIALNKLLNDQKGKCFYCGKKLNLKNASRDHVIPKSKPGGANTVNNLVVCCKNINRHFGNMMPKEKMYILLHKRNSIKCSGGS